jgi:hypothetical protein
MDGVANGADTTLCTNCGHELRRGMLRCRECGQSTVESGDEFELNGHQLVPNRESANQDPKCPLCGAFLEPGATDCAACTSDLLDQLLNGSGSNAVDSSDSNSNPNSPRPASPVGKLHVRRAVHVGSQHRSAPGIGPATKLRDVPARAPQANSPKAKAKSSPAAKAGNKPVSQFAKPADFEAANQKAVNQHAVEQQNQAAVETTADAEESAADASNTVETSAACTALLASLATADAQLRCGIATALGKLGDKQALVPLERHLSDQDIRVRRAVAGALVQLGHPKGQTLLDIAERKPAAAVLEDHRAAATPYSAPKPRKSSGGGSSIDPDTLKKVGGAILALAVAGGGVWYFMNSGSSGGARKGKSAAAKKAAAKKAKAGKSE